MFCPMKINKNWIYNVRQGARDSNFNLQEIKRHLEFFLHILSFETYRKFSRKKYNSEIRTLVKNIKNK